MKYLKTLGLAAIAAATTMAFAGPASADPSYATSPAGTKYKGTIHATSGVTALHNAFTTAQCYGMTLAGTITADKDNGTTASTSLSTFTFPTATTR